MSTGLASVRTRAGLLGAAGRLWVAAALALLLMPAALGATYAPLARWLGGEPDHRCMCGMKRGSCGCPECEHLERQRLADRKKAHSYPIVRGTCADDGELPAAPSLPIAEPPSMTASLPSPAATVAIVATVAMRSQRTIEPSTPPPRA